MEELKKFFIIVLFLIIMIPMKVNANLLAECSTCNATGKCSKCFGEKVMTCDQCSGMGTIVCDKCDGTGNGICGDCNGSGQYGNDGEEVCRQCNGMGKEICNGCNGSLKSNCPRCLGKGNIECTRCDGLGKCRQCNGTGYRDGQNNGITNIPKKGDTVQKLNGTNIKWTGNVTNSDIASPKSDNNLKLGVSGENIKQQPVMKNEEIYNKEEETDLVGIGTLHPKNVPEKIAITEKEHLSAEDYNLKNTENIEITKNAAKIESAKSTENIECLEENVQEKEKNSNYILLYVILLIVIVGILAIILMNIKKQKD